MLLKYVYSNILNCLCFFAIVLTDGAFLLLLLCITIQLGYVLSYFVHIFSIKGSKPYIPSIPVSVIICAKNEAGNLREYLPHILAQRYTNEAGNHLFEVIVVDDASEDDTASVLRDLTEQYSNLVIVTISKDERRAFPGKKYALSKGLEKAKYEIIMLTDADCEPASEHWLSKMVKPVSEGKELSIGYGGYIEEPGFLNAFIRWETMHTFLQYSTYAMAGVPYMAVGRNMATTKTAIYKAQSSPQWSALPSGDDDLLIRAIGNKKNIAVIADGDAFTRTKGKNNWDEWVSQKQRHLSTGKFYKFGMKLRLGLYASSHAVMWLSFVLLLFTSLCTTALIAMGARCLVYWVLWAYLAKQLKELRLLLLYPVLDICWMLYNFAFSPYILWKNKQKWT